MRFRYEKDDSKNVKLIFNDKGWSWNKTLNGQKKLKPWWQIQPIKKRVRLCSWDETKSQDTTHSFKIHWYIKSNNKSYEIKRFW